MNCAYVFASLIYTIAGLLYGYVLWRYLEAVDKYAHG